MLPHQIFLAKKTFEQYLEAIIEQKSENFSEEKRFKQQAQHLF